MSTEAYPPQWPNSGDSEPDLYDPADPEHLAQGGLAFVIVAAVAVIFGICLTAGAAWFVARLLHLT